MSEPTTEREDESDEPLGRVDLASVLYVVCGIPSMILFFVVLFLLTGSCDQSGVFLPS